MFMNNSLFGGLLTGEILKFKEETLLNLVEDASGKSLKESKRN